MITGHARLVARNTIEVGDTRYEAANLLLLLARAAVPPIPGIQTEFTLDSNSVFELQQVPKSIAIVGGGYIGLEFACFFQEIGASVQVFEMLPISAGADGEISARMLRILTKKGIEFHLAAKVLRIEGHTLHFAAQDGTQSSVEAEYILNSTGARECGRPGSGKGWHRLYCKRRQDFRAGQNQRAIRLYVILLRFVRWFCPARKS